MIREEPEKERELGTGRLSTTTKVQPKVQPAAQGVFGDQAINPHVILRNDPEVAGGPTPAGTRVVKFMGCLNHGRRRKS